MFVATYSYSELKIIYSFMSFGQSHNFQTVTESLTVSYDV